MYINKQDFFLDPETGLPCGSGSRKIISPTGKIWTYLHNYRTGGMSFHHWCYDNLKLAHFCTRQHENIKDTRIILGDLGQVFFTVRNPWDWCVSRWSHRIMRDAEDPPLSFERWIVEKLARWSRHREMSYMLLQRSAMEIEKGAIALRFENLETDFVQIQEALQCHVPLPHVNASPHEHYTDYYSAKTRRFVGEIFEDYNKVFGYKYGE